MLLGCDALHCNSQRVRSRAVPPSLQAYLAVEVCVEIFDLAVMRLHRAPRNPRHDRLGGDGRLGPSDVLLPEQELPTLHDVPGRNRRSGSAFVRCIGDQALTQHRAFTYTRETSSFPGRIVASCSGESPGSTPSCTSSHGGLRHQCNGPRASQ